MVDEEAIGSVDRPGCGAKILRGDGALGRYITRTNMPNSPVRFLITRSTNSPTTYYRGLISRLFSKMK